MITDGKVLVICNPASRRGEGAKAAYHVRRLLRERMGTDAVDEVQTATVGHAVELAAEAAGTYRTVVTVGGDGVIHEAANGIMSLPLDQRPALGVVPMGIGNDFARTLGMSEQVEEAVAQLLAAQEKRLDVGEVNGEYFVETLSFGVDAAIAIDTMERRRHSNRSGAALYFEAGIDQLLYHLDDYQISAVLDGQRALNTEVVAFAVQIGPTYGGGFRICPEAKPDNGLLDICYAVAPWSVQRAVYTFARVKLGKHVGARGIHFEQAKTLELRFGTEPPVQADGEKIEGTEFKIRICPHELAVLVPPAR